MLATMWGPSTNPVGPASILAASIIAIYAGVAWWTRWRVMLVAGPLIFLALAAMSGAMPFVYWRRFLDADDFAAYYLLLSASSVFAMELARCGTLASLVIALPFLFVAGWFLALDLVRFSNWEFAIFRRMTLALLFQIATGLWLPLFLLTSWRITAPYRRNQRVQHGCCRQCGYDLRASPERCPECGAASPASTSISPC